MLKSQNNLPSKNILMILTGSIACYKSCNIISRLKQSGYNLKVILSPSSLQFIGKASIEGLTGEPPITEMYATGHTMEHINLDRWADLILVAPATANYINKISHGLGDDLLTTLFLAHDFKKPFLIAPAMNTKMYLHPTTQASIHKLKEMKIVILETASGVLACGEIGFGKLLDPELIFKEVEKRINTVSYDSDKPINTSKAINTDKSQIPKILITSGGTSEPLDDVRVITNKSTGKTASIIADSLIESGFDVTYLHSVTALKPTNPCTQITFETFNDLKTQLYQILQKAHFDFVIHAAAVSDYSPSTHLGKINSDQDELTLTFKKNPKLINEIKKITPSTVLFGFKLTSTNDNDQISKKVTNLFESAMCDYVIQNDWQNIKNKNYRYRIYTLKQHKQNFNEMIFQEINEIQSLCASIFQKITTGKEEL